MKTMLILTDFSENAFRAAEYGAQIADPLHIQRIILYHAYQTVVMGTDLPVSSTKESQQIYLEGMENLALVQDRIKPMVPHIPIELMAEDISLPAHIKDFCKHQGIDILVMGVSGRSGLERLLLGSTSSLMIAEARVPVLVVPKDTPLAKPMTSIVFATDLKDHSSVPVHQLYEFLDAFPVDVQVLNIAKEKDEKYDVETKEAITNLHNIFEKYNATFDYVREDDIVEGILDYSNRHHASLLMVVPQERGFIASLFHNSISKKLAYNANIPLLSLPPGATC
ncbi:nucleotide-binding universal stress UspA family protein [Chitinophaga polysaccharea]|uniref:Nucleotide-binding universal stress UspA family protein n=1 Tax=Chitinophaga polysaccharea TaxID=1293035 RepID=A0A561PR03_9BACT|nr:universal stress protein [Chitinophaga polysaccharea]TWF40523.1 nucleotide-binding universal stress UspA family protein [Chitinophaga polysaccharea]